MLCAERLVDIFATAFRAFVHIRSFYLVCVCVPFVFNNIATDFFF